MKNKIFPLLFLSLFLTTSLFAQDVSVRGSGNRKSHKRTRPDGDCSNNFSAKGNRNPYTGKVGTIPCESNDDNSEPGTFGTGEYFLVPAIDRKDPIGTAHRFNTCGTALIALLDKGTIFVLTDQVKQRFTPSTVLSVAESRFRMATEYDPDNYLYYVNLAAVLYRQKKYEEAVANILKAIELNPTDESLKDYAAAIRREKVTVKILDDDEPK